VKSNKGDLTNQAILSEEAVGGIQSASQAVFGSGWVSLGHEATEQRESEQHHWVISPRNGWL